MANVFAIVALCVLAAALAVSLAMLRLHLHARARTGCCTSCNGTGYSGDDAVPNGMCWDCKATGHPHGGKCVPWWRRR